MRVKTVDVQDAVGQLRELLALIQQGTEVIIVEKGIPQARLTSVESPLQPRVPGLHPGAMVAAPDFDEPLGDDFWLSTT